MVATFISKILLFLNMLNQVRGVQVHTEVGSCGSGVEVRSLKSACQSIFRKGTEYFINKLINKYKSFYRAESDRVTR